MVPFEFGHGDHGHASEDEQDHHEKGVISSHIAHLNAIPVVSFKRISRTEPVDS